MAALGALNISWPACECGGSAFSGTVGYDSPSPAIYTAAQLQAYARLAIEQDRARRQEGPTPNFSIVWTICRFALATPTEVLMHQIERLARELIGEEQQALQALLIRARNPTPQTPVTPLVPSSGDSLLSMIKHWGHSTGGVPGAGNWAEIEAALAGGQEASEPAAPDEREAFEAWAHANGFTIYRDDDKYAQYHRATTRWAWQAWQARAAMAQQPKAG